jgi:hypothetical protein
MKASAAALAAVTRFYRLDADGVPQRIADPRDWSRWVESHAEDRGPGGCLVGFDRVDYQVFVSTRFMAVDLRLFPIDGAEPLLWETYATTGPGRFEIWRYTTRAEAVAGHERALQQLLVKMKPAE